MTDAEKLARARELLKRWADGEGCWEADDEGDGVAFCNKCHTNELHRHAFDCIHAQTAKFLDFDY